MIHFFGLQLDRRTADLLLVHLEFLDTHQVRLLEVAALDDKKLYFLSLRRTVVTGLRAILRAIDEEVDEDEEQECLTKCVDHVRRTLGHDYRSLSCEGDALYAPALTCHRPNFGWLTFAASDVKDLTSRTQPG